MNVPVKIVLQLKQAGEQRPVGVAGLRRRGEVVGDEADPGQRGTRVVVLVQHAGDRAVEW